MSNKGKFGRAPWENSRYLTSVAYHNWFNRIYNIAITRFEWENLPDTIPERFLEQVLFWQGYAVGFEDKQIGKLVLPAQLAGEFDIWGDPKRVNAYAYNGEYFVQNLTKENSVQLWNNFSRSSDLSTIRAFAMRLTAIDRTIDVNLAAQKCPRVAAATENEKLSVANMMQKIDNYEPWIFLPKNTADAKALRDTFMVLDLTVPYICDKLQAQKRMTWIECLTYLGIEANNNEKAERQLAAELELTLGQTEAMRYSPLCARQEFAEKFNKMFGTNISVEMRSNLQLTRVMDEDFTDADSDMDKKKNLKSTEISEVKL